MIADWSMKWVFFLNFACWGKISRSRLVLRLTTANAIDKMFFCNNGVSFRDS